jgi:CheY-like chemotaxis protein
MDLSKNVRILVAGATPHGLQILRTAMGVVGITNVVAATTSTAALALLRTQRFDAVFCDERAEPVLDMPFTVAARRAPDLLYPMVPLFLVTGGPRRRDVEAARDKGVSDVLVRPISPATIRRKLAQSLGRPRPFIAAPDFFGPDRRSTNRIEHKGKDRRRRQPRKIKVTAPSEGVVTLI